MLSRLASQGWIAETAENLARARSVLKLFRLDVVLCEENLPDGRGYDLADSVAAQSSTLLVSVALSESCLWLPVIERGERSLGKRALTPQVLEFEVETILSGAHRGALHTNAKCGLPPRRRIPSPAMSPAPSHAFSVEAVGGKS
jgi:DNA-binding response OmpR family regulator